MKDARSRQLAGAALVVALGIGVGIVAIGLRLAARAVERDPRVAEVLALPHLEPPVEADAPAEATAIDSAENRAAEQTARLATETITRHAQAENGAIRVRLEPAPMGPRAGRIRLDGLEGPCAGKERTEELGGAGAVSFDSLAAGRYGVGAVLFSKGCNHAPEVVELEEGGFAEVVLRPGPARLWGRITSVGAPVSPEWMTCYRTHSRMGFRATAALDGEGGYEIDGLVEGTYELFVHCADAPTISFAVEVESENTCFDVQLPAGRIEGRLVDVVRKGNSSDWNNVLVLQLGYWQAAGGLGALVEADDEGRFVARHLAPGDYLVSYSHATRRVPTRAVTITPAEPIHQVVLAPAADPGRIVGRVDPPSPPWGWWVVWLLRRDEHGLRPEANCAVDGQGGDFHFEGLEPGRYAVFVHGSIAGQRFRPMLWQPDVLVSKGETTTLVLVQPKCGAVSIALDAGGSWTSRSIWKLRMPSGDWLPSTPYLGGDLETRETLALPISLPCGDYAVAADFGDARPVVREFTLEPGEDVMEIVVRREY